MTELATAPDDKNLDEKSRQRVRLILGERYLVNENFAEAKKYITDPKRLAQERIVKAARGLVPGLLVPLRRKEGSAWGCQYRPDNPRCDTKSGEPNVCPRLLWDGSRQRGALRILRRRG